MLSLPEDNPGWFQIDSLDRDNFRYHLDTTAAWEAWLAQQTAEAEKNHALIKLQADTYEDELFVSFKRTPLEIRKAGGGYRDKDVSDELAHALAKTNPQYIALRQLEIDWKCRLQTLKGMMRAFDTKKTFMACQSGLTRQEIQQFWGNR